MHLEEVNTTLHHINPTRRGFTICPFWLVKVAKEGRISEILAITPCGGWMGEVSMVLNDNHSLIATTTILWGEDSQESGGTTTI